MELMICHPLISWWWLFFLFLFLKNSLIYLIHVWSDMRHRCLLFSVFRSRESGGRNLWDGVVDIFFGESDVSMCWRYEPDLDLLLAGRSGFPARASFCGEPCDVSGDKTVRGPSLLLGILTWHLKQLAED